MRYLVLALLFVVAHAEAKPKRAAGGASRMDGSEFYSCVQSALNGRFDGDCAFYGLAPECIGANLALDYSFRKLDCKQHGRSGCRVHGYLDASQADWMSTASGHIALFMDCVRHRYGTPESNGRKEALADPQLLTLLRSIPDGSIFLGYENGEILRRSLTDERLSSILAKSPKARDLPFDELELLKQAADNPIAIRDPERNPDARGNNPTQNGEQFRHAFASSFGFLPELQAFSPDEWASSAPPVTVGGTPAGALAVDETAAKGESSEPTSRAPAAAGGTSTPDHVFVREYKENPYSLGLDRTLFDRVSLTYRRHASDLKSMEMYLRAAGKREPRDLSEALRRGRAL